MCFLNFEDDAQSEPPSFIKWGWRMRFSKMVGMWGWGRGWEIFTRNGVKPRMGGGLGFIMGGSFFNIVGRGVLTLLFHEKTPILPPSLFFRFCRPSSPSHTLSCHLKRPSHCFFCHPVSLAEWVITPHLICLSSMSSLRTLVPEKLDVCFM